MTQAKVLHPRQFQRVAPKTASAKAAAKRRPVRTYVVRYTWFGGEIVTETFRFRAPELTKVQLMGTGALVGEIAFPLGGGKWGPYSMGALPRVSEYVGRLIVEIGDDSVGASG